MDDEFIPDIEAAVDYLRDHGIATLLGKATAALAQERPARPRTWLAQRIVDGGNGPLPQAAAYLRQAGIGETIDKAVTALAAKRPDNPRAWLADYILEMDSSDEEDNGYFAGNEDAVENGVASGNGVEPHWKKAIEKELCGHSRNGVDVYLNPTRLESPRVSFSPELKPEEPGFSEEDGATDDDLPSQESMDRNVEVANKMVMVDEVLEELQGYLRATMWTDIYSGIEEWVKERRTTVPSHPFLPPDSSSSSEQAIDTPPQPPLSATLAEGVVQTLRVLKDTIANYKRGNVTVELHVTNACSQQDFTEVIRQFECMDKETEAGQLATLKPFGVRRREDDFRQMVHESQVLMWAQICVSKDQKAFSEAQNFEIFVNLVGHSSYKSHRAAKTSFDSYDVIPSFGQLVNVAQMNHKGLCSPDAVVRTKRLIEGLHHFKMALVRVAEHIIHSVIEGEFLRDVARRMSEAGMEHDEPLFKRLAERRKSTPGPIPEPPWRRQSLNNLKKRRQSAPTLATQPKPSFDSE